MKELNTAAGAIIVAMVIMIPVALWQAWCLMILWHWYAPDMFGPLSMKVAIGASLALGLLQLKAPKKDDAGIADRITTAIVGPPVILLAGWLLLFFV